MTTGEMREWADNTDSSRERDTNLHSRANDDWAWGDGQQDAGGSLADESEWSGSGPDVVADTDASTIPAHHDGEARAADSGGVSYPSDGRRGAGAVALFEDTQDNRDAVLAGYALDQVSREQAVTCGEVAARQFRPEQWSAGDFDDRIAALRAAERVLTAELSLQPAPAMLDSRLTGRTLGWSDGERVGIATSIIEADTPTDMLETLAHEYRHQWQQKVIVGDLDHPAGESARTILIKGQADYQTYDYDAYINNGLELDAEAFALAVSAAYDDIVNKGE